ncbi:MAG: adenylate/guanylate cyclase domain-containing protein [Actinomycetota bacterium]
MLHFPDPTDAVRCSLSLVSAIPAAGLPPARVGINAGPLILRDTDFFGRTVNVAARLLDYARPREVLTTTEVTKVAAEPDLVFDSIGPVTLKGVSEPIEVFVADVEN